MNEEEAKAIVAQLKQWCKDKKLWIKTTENCKPQLDTIEVNISITHQS